jgi:hypothetical protein
MYIYALFNDAYDMPDYVATNVKVKNEFEKCIRNILNFLIDLQAVSSS